MTTREKNEPLWRMLLALRQVLRPAKLEGYRHHLPHSWMIESNALKTSVNKHNKSQLYCWWHDRPRPVDPLGAGQEPQIK